jgi:hypothetical protein
VVDEGVGGISLLCTCPVGIGLANESSVPAPPPSSPVTGPVGPVGSPKTNYLGLLPVGQYVWTRTRTPIHTRRPVPILPARTSALILPPRQRGLPTSLASVEAEISAGELNTEGTFCSIGEVVAVRGMQSGFWWMLRGGR